MSADRADPTFVFVVPWDLGIPGGVNEVVINLHHEVLAAGELQPLALIGDWSAPRPIERVVAGRRTVYLRLWSLWTDSSEPSVGLVRLIAAAVLCVVSLLRFCRRYRVAAFNFQYPSLAAFPVALLRCWRLYRGALILSFHGLDLATAKRAGPLGRFLWRFVWRYSTAAVACSQALAAELRTFAGRWAGKVHAIRNGLDVDRFHSLRAPTTNGGPLSALGTREFILSVATLEHKKGLDALLRSFAELRRTQPELALVLVGRPAGAEPGLRALAQDLAIAEHVHFCGLVPHSQIGAFLERAKVFCLPSRSEPFGIAILEAGAYRLPVVASRVGGVPEIVTDGQTGLLIEPEDVAGLTAGLQRVLRDPPLARELGERLYQRVSSDFPWRRAYDAYRALVPLPSGMRGGA